MAEFDNVRRAQGAHAGADIDAGLRAHMTRVYGLMSVAMVVTAIVAFAVGNSTLVYTLNDGLLRWVIMFLPLIMVFAFGAAIRKLSYAGATLFFYAFAAAMGLSISYIFVVFTDASIATTFVGTAAGFMALSIYGYTTKNDLSSWGRFLMMGLVGLIVASLLNIFIGSEGLSFAISVIGILIFAGLTAYDTQNIKNTYLQMRNEGETVLGKLAIMGALSLYINFINMFMFLLQFLGQRE